MYLHDRKLFLASVCQHIKENLQPNLFLTFNFNPPREHEYHTGAATGDWLNSISSTHKKLTRFFNEMQEIAYGKSWKRQTSRHWPTAVGFCEHKDTNIHFHVFANTGARFGALIDTRGANVWSEVLLGGTFNQQAIYNLDGALQYCMKEQWKPDAENTIFFYSDPRPPLDFKLLEEPKLIEQFLTDFKNRLRG